MSITEEKNWRDVIFREIERAVREVHESRDKEDALTEETPKPPSNPPEQTQTEEDAK